MKTLTSTEFRRTYASLEEPTEVTALGRLIGTWFPVGSLTYPGMGVSPTPPVLPLGQFTNTTTFTPVPKPGKKK